MLITLKHPEEVIAVEDLPTPKGRALEKNEVKIAQSLIALLEGEFEPAEFQDEYRARLLDFIESKARGHASKLKRPRSKRAPASLESALTRSIAALKKRKEKAAA